MALSYFGLQLGSLDFSLFPGLDPEQPVLVSKLDFNLENLSLASTSP